MEKTRATLRLFSAVEVNKAQQEINILKIEESTFPVTIPRGYFVQPQIELTIPLIDAIDSIVGISGEKANASFHKSWKIVQDSSMEDLFIQQIIHYITTYGFESLGIYSESTVYIPNEKLELPGIKDDISLVVIKAMTNYEILDKIVELGSSGIALKQETLDDIMTIIKVNKYNHLFIGGIKNRELKALLYDYYDIVPSDPVEFLRHLISKLTDESLVIKNKYLIDKIKASNGKFLDELLKKAPDDLASIFFRYKPLFLAMKSISNNKTFFNQLRKKANTLHKPLPEDYLNSITAQIKQGRLDISVLKDRLKKATIWRKVRLAYALKYRIEYTESIMYRVRNGKGWAEEFGWLKTNEVIDSLNVVIDSIVDSVSKNVKGKTIYIPDSINYALPATEKQFTGNIPTNSYVAVPEDMIVGIYWKNLPNYRVDLDLSMLAAGLKVGWDSSYRIGRDDDEEYDIMFSGDVTDAQLPNGATELFYIKKDMNVPYLLNVNYYNFSEDHPVSCKIIIASESPSNFGENYMVDVNNIITMANVNIDKHQDTLGLVYNVEGENRFYFTNVFLQNKITSKNSDVTEWTRKYLINKAKYSISLKDILEKAGTKVVNEKPTETIDFINLAPEALDKVTIIDLLKD